ncbi:hypothetical protein AB0M43_21355 [Longispora sp. NPDC051575]|uniref:hypothetical protein n=1 Tax=Longispora sp. NPDC051575 TaxID=3154943 RepID=UPI003431429D
MERVTPRLLVPVAALLILAGCGGQPQPATKTQTTPSPVRTSAAPGTDAPGTLSITQSGTTPANTIWYARVETPNGRSLAEASFNTGPITLDKSLPPGRYRAISWHRACTGTCPTSGEKGLGPLAEVCGAAVTVPAGGRVTATVVIGEAGTCTVRP